MEKQDLIEFVRKNGTNKDKVNLVGLQDSQLRTIVQRLISEKRVSSQKHVKNGKFKNR